MIDIDIHWAISGKLIRALNAAMISAGMADNQRLPSVVLNRARLIAFRVNVPCWAFSS
jgi:hypothetical protein